LKLEDFLPLALHLDAHAFDFPSDMVEVWHFGPVGWLFGIRTKRER